MFFFVEEIATLYMWSIYDTSKIEIFELNIDDVWSVKIGNTLMISLNEWIATEKKLPFLIIITAAGINDDDDDDGMDVTDSAYTEVYY